MLTLSGGVTLLVSNVPYETKMPYSTVSARSRGSYKKRTIYTLPESRTIFDKLHEFR